MDYDSLTDEEWSEYQRLSAKQPDTAAERVDRYIHLASKGWAGSRAADACFEMGDGNEVMRLLLKRVQDDAPLLERLRGQGAWCSSWDEMLTASNPVENPSILKTEFTWAGIKIEVTYKPQWCKLTNTSHLEVRSLAPERARLPITETGRCPSQGIARALYYCFLVLNSIFPIRLITWAIPKRNPLEIKSVTQ